MYECGVCFVDEFLDDYNHDILVLTHIFVCTHWHALMTRLCILIVALLCAPCNSRSATKLNQTIMFSA